VDIGALFGIFSFRLIDCIDFEELLPSLTSNSGGGLKKTTRIFVSSIMKEGPQNCKMFHTRKRGPATGGPRFA